MEVGFTYFIMVSHNRFAKFVFGRSTCNKLRFVESYVGLS